jgi:hypothetical protein
MAFVTWLINFDTSLFDNWLLAGDFNLYKSPEDKNKPGGDPTEMAIFNSLILDLDLLEIPFNGRSFTWSNMQLDPPSSQVRLGFHLLLLGTYFPCYLSAAPLKAYLRSLSLCYQYW